MHLLLYISFHVLFLCVPFALDHFDFGFFIFCFLVWCAVFFLGKFLLFWFCFIYFVCVDGLWSVQFCRQYNYNYANMHAKLMRSILLVIVRNKFSYRIQETRIWLKRDKNLISMKSLGFFGVVVAGKIESLVCLW